MKIVFLEDEFGVQTVLKLKCKKYGLDAKFYSMPYEFIDEIKDDPQAKLDEIDYIITDFDMGGESALDLLDYLEQNNLSANVFLHSGNMNACAALPNEYPKYVKRVFLKASDTSQLFDLLNELNNT